MGEVRPDAIYTLMDETGDPLHPMFVISVMLDGETFYGSGVSKKLAKGRAARAALRKIYNLEFGTSESKLSNYKGNVSIVTITITWLWLIFREPCRDEMLL